MDGWIEWKESLVSLQLVDMYVTYVCYDSSVQLYFILNLSVLVLNDFIYYFKQIKITFRLSNNKLNKKNKNKLYLDNVKQYKSATV